ncbi:MAG: hypothetical protein JWM76_3302 [Pseudonocardiales bacterium]|nr:hypothetical protein [Pseudonocardiales bacterium]
MSVDTAAPASEDRGSHSAIDRSGSPSRDVAGVGRVDGGTISIANRVVQKIASRAAIEIPDAGAAAPRILGRSMAAVAQASPGGIRETSLDSLPKVSADVDGAIVVLDLEISVRWPASVPAVTTAVRDHVRDQVNRMTSLNVQEIQIKVTDLVTHLAPPPRVQ